jgi:hypothetical protein
LLDPVQIVQPRSQIPEITAIILQRSPCDHFLHVSSTYPEAAYVIERPHLRPLPEGDALPPVYELLERVVDLHGFVSVEA